MSRLISEILNAQEPSFSQRIGELEHLAGQPGFDIKLTRELKKIFKKKSGLLGLDENDTTPEELYFAMRKSVLQDSEALSKIVGVKADDSPEAMVKKSVAFIERRVGKKKVWALKSSTLRKQLKANPPNKLMKIFSIRSIDSAIKRERISLLYSLARLTEAMPWMVKYVSQASQLTNSDFDNTEITISAFSARRQKQLDKAGIKLRQIVYSDQESGGIEIAIPAKRFNGDVFFIADSLLVQIKNMLRRSAYYRYYGFNPDFFTKIQRIRANGFPTVEQISHPFDWSTLVHATTELGIGDVIQDSELNTNLDDLLVPSISQLGKFSFWQHPFAMHRGDGATISLNASDMIVNAINETPLEQAYLENGRSALRRELFARYLSNERVRDGALHHLSSADHKES